MHQSRQRGMGGCYHLFVLCERGKSSRKLQKDNKSVNHFAHMAVGKQVLGARALPENSLKSYPHVGGETLLWGWVKTQIRISYMCHQATTLQTTALGLRHQFPQFLQLSDSRSSCYNPEDDVICFVREDGGCRGIKMGVTSLYNHNHSNSAGEQFPATQQFLQKQKCWLARCNLMRYLHKQQLWFFGFFCFAIYHILLVSVLHGIPVHLKCKRNLALGWHILIRQS